MHRVQKFIEAGSGRIGYAMTFAALSEAATARSGIRILRLTLRTPFLPIRISPKS
jgi:hypothetical protein